MRKAMSSIKQVSTIVVMASACAKAPAPLSETERAAVRDTVTALFNACIEEEKLGNPEICLGQMSRDPDFRYFVNTTLSFNADSITERTRRGFANRERWEMEVALDTVAVLGADAAVVTATLRVTTKDIGGPVITRPASWTLVYVRREDGWSIIHGHWTYGEAVRSLAVSGDSLSTIPEQVYNQGRSNRNRSTTLSQHRDPERLSHVA